MGSLTNICFVVLVCVEMAMGQSSVPTMETVDGNLRFLVSDNKRIGYQYGTNMTSVYFDQFSTTDENIGQTLQMMYGLGN